MFEMISKYGNVVMFVETERKRDELISLGYTERDKKPTRAKSSKEKKEKNNEKENSDRT